ncbi:MAG: CBS domain-containing protein [Mariprofundaceae bacterium]|nr:CBS domain-containing protein [Mariprofundaceae bacterium]
MRAKDIMKTAVITAYEQEVLVDLIARVRETHVRMFPVINQERVVVGAVSTFSIMEHLLPAYILSGDLGDLAFAPDMDLLLSSYMEGRNLAVTSLMDAPPLLVNAEESILAVAAALMRYGKHECAIVIDQQQHLLGVISAEDILNSLSNAVEKNSAQ